MYLCCIYTVLSFAAYFALYGHFPLSSFSIRTSQPQRTRAPGTASRPWPPSCPSCLGIRRTGWSCTIRTGTPPLLTHRTRPREISRLKCEDTQTYTHSLEYTHAHAEIQRHTEMVNFWKAIHKWFSAKISHTLLLVSTNVLRRIPYCICLLLQWTDMERRLFYSIFSQRLLKSKNRGLTRLWLMKIFKWT